VVSGWKVANVTTVSAAGVLDLVITYETPEGIDEEDDLNAIARAMGENDEEANGAGIVAEEKEVQIAQSELITPKLIKRG
jgi:hypothetical protein